jgi:hypothetical protein
LHQLSSETSNTIDTISTNISQTHTKRAATDRE